jgi:Calx-beta domain-containing protein
MNKTRLATLIASTLTVAAVGAGPASAAPPSITTGTVDEGAVATIPVSHKCGAKKCTYDIRTVDGTAVSGSDYTPAALAGKAKKKKTIARTLFVQTLDDASSEADETFTVRVTVTSNGKSRAFDATETIIDNDGETDPGAGPPGGVPTNPPGTETGNNFSVGGRYCKTPYSAGGSRPQYGPGLQLAHCYVAVRCPTTVESCGASAANHLREYRTPGDEAVMGSIKTTVAAVNGGRTEDADYCFDFGSCVAGVNNISLNAGDWLIADCGGAHDPNNVRPETDRLPEPDRLSITCDVNLYY